MISSHALTHLIHQDGVALVFVVVALQAAGAPLPGTTALILAALYASTAHGLPIVGVLAAGILGGLLGTTVGYVIGRTGGEPLLHRLAARLSRSRRSRARITPERVDRLRAEFAAGGGAALVVGRFISGLRNICGLLAGASGMPWPRFLAWSAVSVTAWTLINGLEYYWFGHALLGASWWLKAVLILLGIAWTVVSFRLVRRRFADAGAQVN